MAPQRAQTLSLPFDSITRLMLERFCHLVISRLSRGREATAIGEGDGERQGGAGDELDVGKIGSEEGQVCLLNRTLAIETEY